MLHQETVSRGTLELIRKLQNDKLFEQFVLVGDTSLALQIGHRFSIDIDLFSRSSFEASFCIEHLEKEYGFSMQYSHKNTVKGIIDGVFVDLITHDYTYVEPPLAVEGIRLLTKADIAAMKVNVISGNETRSKDFIDIYFLLKTFSFQEIIDFYSIKYGSRNEFHAIKSLTYFEDVNEDNWPVLIREPQLTLTIVKEEIIRKRDEYLKGS